MVEVAQLLKPISEHSRAGEDLSFSPEFDVMAEARRADDPTLEQGAWQTDLKTADWPEVVRIGHQLLQERSKDLRIAVWLTEAYTRLDGFAGLARGYRLTAHLCESFWDDLWPQDEHEDDGMQRIGHVRWLLTRSEHWARTLPLTQSAEGCFSANDFQSAYQPVNANDIDMAERPTPERVEAARQSTPFDFFHSLDSALSDCRDALAHLETVMEEKAGDDGPGFRACRETIAHTQSMVKRFLRGVDGSVADVAIDDDQPDANAASSSSALDGKSAASETTNNNGATTINKTPGEIASRHEALAQLRQVAAFFRRTEPQSPVAYLADKAAKWGEMPLHVWLRQVIKDEGTLSHVEELLDVNRRGSDD